ncbi:MAG: hypothetical protein ACTSXG_03625 [Alphaproteobacteria bacterium]
MKYCFIVLVFMSCLHKANAGKIRIIFDNETEEKVTVSLDDTSFHYSRIDKFDPEEEYILGKEKKRVDIVAVTTSSTGKNNCEYDKLGFSVGEDDYSIFWCLNDTYLFEPFLNNGVVKKVNYRIEKIVEKGPVYIFKISEKN